MELKKVFTGTLYVAGAALTMLSVTSIGYLCGCGLMAPMRESELRRRIKRARDDGYRRGSVAGRRAGYVDGESVGHASGYASGYAEGHSVGYDDGYLAAAKAEYYMGRRADVLEELKMDPYEHARKLAEMKAAAERQAEESADAFDEILSIFQRGKKLDAAVPDPSSDPGVQPATGEADSPEGAKAPGEQVMQDAEDAAESETQGSGETERTWPDLPDDPSADLNVVPVDETEATAE